MTAPERVIDWPDEWAVRSEPIDYKAFNAPEGMQLLMVLFDEGVNAYALIHDNGARFARLSPDTGWAIEERFVGRPASQRQRKAVKKAWKFVTDTMAEGNRIAREAGL